MPNAQDVRAVYCPSCGASISMDGAKGICAYCGTVVERPVAAQRASERVRQPTVIITQRQRSGNPAGRVLTLLILVVTVTLVLVQVAPGGKFAHLLGSVAQVVPANTGTLTTIAAVLPRDGPGYDLLAYFYHSGDSYSLGLLDGTSRAVRWQSQSLSKQAISGRVVSGGQMVYLTDESRLLALRLSDGTVAWQTSLVAEPPSGCDDCLRLLAGRVVTLQKDGSLQAFDAQSGRLAWSVRLPNTPRELTIAGDRVVTLEPPTGDHGGLLDLRDPASGQAVQQIAPSCPRGDSIPGAESPNVDSPLLFSSDGTAMYALFGFLTNCAQRWNLTNGERVWQQSLDRAVFPTIWFNNRPLLSDKALFVSNSGVLSALDTATGAWRSLLDDKEYNFIPLAARDDTLIVLAWPTWDSSRQVLWGLDTATGERRWQYALQAKESRLLRPFGDWDARLTAKGLVVVQVLKEQRQLIVDRVDPRTGVSAARQTTSLGASYVPTFWQALWADDMAWLKINSTFYAVDLTTGAKAYQLP